MFLKSHSIETFLIDSFTISFTLLSSLKNFIVFESNLDNLRSDCTKKLMFTTSLFISLMKSFLIS